MKLDAGRAMLHSALQTLQIHWDNTDPHWQDVMREQFSREVREPLAQQVAVALEAIDQLQVVLDQMRRDCEADDHDLHHL